MLVEQVDQILLGYFSILINRFLSFLVYQLSPEFVEDLITNSTSSQSSHLTIKTLHKFER
jgi:hypothetical protein